MNKNNYLALVFPPLFLNDFNGPYLSLPQLLGYLESRGITGTSVYDTNLSLWKKLVSIECLENFLRTIENGNAWGSTTGDPAHKAHQRLVMKYLFKNHDTIKSDPLIKRLYAGIILDRYRSHMPKNIQNVIRHSSSKIDIPHLNDTLDETIFILPEDTRLIGISVPTAEQLYPALYFAAAARKRFGNQAHITLGGPLFALFNNSFFEVMLRDSEVDSVVLYEGEKPLLKLYNNIIKGKGLHDIPNLVYLENDSLNFNSSKPPLRFDESAAPVFSHDMVEFYGDSLVLPILATRGCYWGKCTFCDYIHLSCGWKKYDVIKTDKLIDQIQQLAKDMPHGVGCFDLISECLPPSFVKRFSNDLLTRELDIDWMTHLKIDNAFTIQHAEKMALSGCKKVIIGVESFNDRQLKMMNKGCTMNDIIPLLKSLSNAGIQSTINIIVDFPSTTIGEAEETLRVIKEYANLYESFNVFPFCLSEHSAVAKKPNEYSISPIAVNPDNHNRGFHYLDFKRTSGMDGTDRKHMIDKYHQACRNHKRHYKSVNSLRAIKNNSSEKLQIKPNSRFLELTYSDLQNISNIVPIEKPDSNFILLFDLDSKQIIQTPESLYLIYKALPNSWLSFSTIKKLFFIENLLPEEREEIFITMVKAGATLGLLSVRPESFEG